MNSTWEAFTDDLTDDLSTMTALETRIYSAAARYVQIQAGPPTVALQAVSNTFLPDGQKLTEDEELALDKLGFTEPIDPGQPNWFIDYPWPWTPAQAAAAAQTTVRAIQTIVAVQEPDGLVIARFKA